MLHSQTLVDQLGHVVLLQGHMPWREVEWQRGLRLPRQRTVSGMTRLSKGHIEGAFEVAEVLGEGSAALGCRLHPCAGFVSRNSLVVLTYPASCSLRRWMVKLPPVRSCLPIQLVRNRPTSDGGAISVSNSPPHRPHCPTLSLARARGGSSHLQSNLSVGR